MNPYWVLYCLLYKYTVYINDVLNISNILFLLFFADTTSMLIEGCNAYSSIANNELNKLND